MASSSPPCSSSSSCVPTRGSTYDIFLSFRGEDTRNNFVDHLYAALVQKGIHTFKDDQMLGGGKPISQSLLKAIKESKFAVVVFSKDYANSSWCLEELSEIMDCHDRMGLKVLPVFYHVDPSDVRKQKGNVATAFQEHELNFNGENNEVNKWREALTAAANLSGYHISPVSGGETATINKIVQEILGDIQPRGRENDLIGMESHMDTLNTLLSIEATDEVRFIGIFGMGGIGKTTIARALFSRIAYWFDGSSFINDVRENSSTKRDICALQEKILTDVLGAHHKFMIQDPEYGANMIQERLCNKKVFIVLDNVDNWKQLEFLVATHEWFGPGSRIVITTRDEHLLLDANAKYKPALLHLDQALQLFSRHAFKKNHPPNEFKELSNRAIRYSGRLPLALKVLGSFFRGRKVDVWESALDRLAKTPNSEVLETLKLSFDGLEDLEKKIFLDIACFFKGRIQDDVTRVLDSFGFYAKIGVNSLIEKSLITVSKNRLDMHDLIQEMGRQVVRQSAPDSRLWNYQEIHEIIIENKKLELNEAIVNWWRRNVFSTKGCGADVFKRMKNLRLLDVNQNFTNCKPTFLPHELRWLRWNQYPFSSLPLSNMHKLVGLEMESANIKHLWEGQKIMPNLKFIQLKYLDCLSRFPDVSGAPNIESLILSYCWNLVEVDESLGQLKRLVHLDISHCMKLKRLPSRIEMESLEILILNFCTSLERLPEFSPCMVKLSHINCYGCNEIEALPSSIRNVSSLNILNITDCRSLESIPDSFCELKCLNTLLGGSSKLQKLPHEFGNMDKLQELNLRYAKCFNFCALPNLSSLRKLDLGHSNLKEEDFPTKLDGFSSLEELDLSGNSKLTQLPASISDLSSLKYLSLSWCKQLQSFNGLPSKIQILDATSCISLGVIEDLSEKYEWLYKIWLFGCKKLPHDEQNEIYLDKMLNQTFLKKWALTDGCLSISTPGSKIPSWFKQQQDGNKIALKLPLKWQIQIIGFAICGVFTKTSPLVFPYVEFRFENGGTFVPMLKVDCINASAAVEYGNENVWVGYVPFSLLEKMHHDDNADCQCEDWSHIIAGNVVIEFLRDGEYIVIEDKVVRCGAQVVYRDDVESTQQIIKPSITSSYYWNWKVTHGKSQNTIKCS